MDLGIFSLSLGVKDIEKSLEFYQKFGFKVIDGGHMNEAFADNGDQKWRILESPSVKIGLFQGMFDENIITFIPTDVRSIQKELQKQGVELLSEADLNTKGPASISLKDPDGNSILIDQHNE
ncbi:MAG: VOC family protein [Bacteroidota bacterium]